MLVVKRLLALGVLLLVRMLLLARVWGVVGRGLAEVPLGRGLKLGCVAVVRGSVGWRMTQVLRLVV